MSTIPTLYSSADPGAPVLTGQTGSLRDVLRAVLVTGYGTAPNAKPGAGWTEEFTGSNVSVFRNSPFTGTGTRLRVDDSSTVSGSNARYALLRAYDAMTDVDTGTGPSPTVAQRANGVLVPKSGTLDATARAWVAIASELYVYLFVDVGNTATGWIGVPSFPFFAGDIVSRAPSDNFNFLLLPDHITAMTSTGGSSTGLFTPSTYQSPPGSNCFLLRAYTQASGSKTCQVSALSDGNITGALGSGGTYPDPVSAGLPLERIGIFEGARQVRGWLPNVYGSTTGLAFADMTEVTGLDGFPPGASLLAKRYSHARGGISFPASANGQLYFDFATDWFA